MAAQLRIEQLCCGYSAQPVLSDLSLAIEPGEIACLLGPSGCGKTTLLRAVAGFVAPRAGEIWLGDRLLSSAAGQVPPEGRGMGMVFQDYALFPHLNIADNIAFGLGRVPKSERQRRVREVLELVELPDLSRRYPHELSGGQQQRVALARALAPAPRLLLMDEPFSNLDTELRRQLSRQVRQILEYRGITAIMVTHDQQEAFTIADKIGVLEAGRLRQWGTPEAIYYRPVSPSVAALVGAGELFPGRVMATGVVATELGSIELAEPLAAEVGETVHLFLRPHDLFLSRDGGVPGEVVSAQFQGDMTRYRIRLPSGSEVEVLHRGVRRQRERERVGVRLAAHRPILFSSPDG
ncbi:MAG: ABC transporter ATP-binding protein [Pseudomonadota bacterium]|jgi:iron(III) transport system ATP-binding protein|nr:ABC transporter ATP-binding protein [Pseudomonadota bacterium]